MRRIFSNINYYSELHNEELQVSEMMPNWKERREKRYKGERKKEKQMSTKVYKGRTDSSSSTGPNKVVRVATLLL